MGMVYRFRIFKEVVVGLRHSFVLLCFYPIVDLVYLLLLGLRIEFQVGLVPGGILVPCIIKKGHKFIVFPVLEGIVRMAMALYAADSGALPDLEGGVYPVHNGRYPELLVLGPALVVVHGVPVEGGGDELVPGGI